MKTKNSTYLILTLVLLILSAIGAYFLYQIYQDRQLPSYDSATVPKIELIPTDTLEPEIIDIPENATSPAVSLTPKVATPTALVTQIPTKVISPTPTTVPTATPTKTPSAGTTQTYTSQADNFSIVYSSSRQLYQDTEATGNRYTFTLASGNFAIHVSTPPQWSWTHPNREFTDTFLISGKPTFRYDIATQTIVDLQSDTKNYTLQCVHNGVASLKTECDQFINSFKLL
ncbi:MAG TPA: hypothetical protein PKZ92_00845 [Candidatus Woesebacteria bacterium]|jgi:hypothetical protein|nr:hypothetical protein [Candidatus Shapirobacteria bacterium]HOR01790.1 hypothetical protein [Candidatus Woesebacteria bacterium]